MAKDFDTTESEKQLLFIAKGKQKEPQADSMPACLSSARGGAQSSSLKAQPCSGLEVDRKQEGGKVERALLLAIKWQNAI